MFSSIFASVLLATSLATPSLHPKKVANNSGLVGSYNFNNVFDLSTFSDTHTTAVTFNIVFDDTYADVSPDMKVPCNVDETLNYLALMSFEYAPGDYFDLEITYYNPSGTQYNINVRSLWYDSLQDYTPDICYFHFFLVDNFFLQDVDYYDYFNFFFTNEDNDFVTSYTGYYSFNNSSSYNYDFIALGWNNYNQYTYNTLYRYDSTQLGFRYYNLVDDIETIDRYSLPLRYGNNVLFSNVKISNLSKNRMQSVGIFAYVRDTTYDNATFSDLLFGVMDAPLYFITSLLSWELFGVNLFLAFTGLLTICVVLVLIRKFF